MNRYKLGQYENESCRIYAVYQLFQKDCLWSYISIYESKDYVDTLHVYNMRTKEAA